MDLRSSPETFLFDQFRLDRRGGLFHCVDGTAPVPVSIGSRALDVLAVLVERSGDLVSKDEIMAAVWPNTAVEDANLTVQISTLRRILDQGRSGGSCIRTLPGKGYRFAVRVTQGTQLHAVRALPAAVPRLSLVVLPFKSLGADAQDEHVADGITDDLITDLSRQPGTFIIARSSAYSYKGRSVDARTVGEDLGVRYVVDGSIRRLGDLLRLNVQLVSAETGAHLWADRFDECVASLSAGQEKIVQRVGQTLYVAVTDIESARSKRERPTNPDVFDLLIRARSIGAHPMGPGEHAERIALFEQLLRLDPTAILALTGLAEELIRFTCIYDLGYELPRAGSLLTQAMAIDPDHCEVLDTLAYLHYHQGRYNESISVNRRLMDYYPNHSAAYNQIGGALIRMGEAEEAIAMIQTAIRRDPRNRYNFSRYENMGLALLMLERDEESIVWLQRAAVANPNNDPTILAKHNVWMAAAFARLGRCDDAHRAVAEANRIWPHGTVRMHAPGDSPWRVYAAQIERFQAALRLAGQRDHAEEDADFGVASDTILHACLSGLTPTTAKGVRTICTAELELLLAERTPIVIDSLMYSWGRSIPGAIGLKRAGWGSSYTDAAQDRLARKMHELTAGDHATPIVAVGWNSERFDGRNLALRLVALGYTNVYWYRGGREAWEVAGLPETELVMHDW